MHKNFQDLANVAAMHMVDDLTNCPDLTVAEVFAKHCEILENFIGAPLGAVEVLEFAAIVEDCHTQAEAKRAKVSQIQAEIETARNYARAMGEGISPATVGMGSLWQASFDRETSEAWARVDALTRELSKVAPELVEIYD